MHKWFAREAHDDELVPAEARRAAEAFMAESDEVPELRANPRYGLQAQAPQDHYQAGRDAGDWIIAACPGIREIARASLHRMVTVSSPVRTPVGGAAWEGADRRRRTDSRPRADSIQNAGCFSRSTVIR